MTKKEIQDQITFLKADYIRIQGDLDKLEAAGGNIQNAEKQLARMEEELKELNKQLAQTEQ
ncbi:SE1832 family protein [Halobacillus litoralis]|uniref:SE1832 family protein n=1 Tax=Halobacillus litoralis TaxID=45668 RepID=UPI001CFC8FEE|nr:SE1832 family protein [Halobacillus litoralis]WLR48839.1 SE1832 family protein [Halobacillus litoralis]